VSANGPLPVDRLREAMAARHLSSDRLAELAGVSLSTITRALAGRPVRTETYGRIIAALKTVPVDSRTRAVLAELAS